MSLHDDDSNDILMQKRANYIDIPGRSDQFSLLEYLESVMSEALNSEITVSTSKTGSCLDSIAVGVPVVEYYTYSNGIEDNMQNEFKINGKIMSLFKYYRLVKSFDDYHKLNNFFIRRLVH